MSSRDEEFSEYVRGAYPRLVRTAYLLCGNGAQAEDLVQDARARTYLAWPRIKDKGRDRRHPDSRRAGRLAVPALPGQWRSGARGDAGQHGAAARVRPLGTGQRPAVGWWHPAGVHGDRQPVRRPLAVRQSPPESSTWPTGAPFRQVMWISTSGPPVLDAKTTSSSCAGPYSAVATWYPCAGLTDTMRAADPLHWATTDPPLL